MPSMLPIRFYNSLTRATETFTPAEAGKVSMYNCGPTVYDYGHIGNFRSFLFADTLRRFLELAGYEVNQVMNLTDVGHMTVDNLADGAGEDKMKVGGERLKEAKKQGKAGIDNPDDPWAVAQFFIDAFVADAKAVGLKIAGEYPAKMPRATAFVPQMQAIIARLIARGHAYQVGDAVYFSVESFPAYGRLSGNTLDKLRGGAGGRVSDDHQAGKKHPADFLLWKADPSHIMKWDSPWGAGYPGWHIECSAMAASVLKREVIDIHTGGEDNIFPHHECEIAQSCCGSAHPNHSHFARTWMHARFLLVEGEKMSKSKGNFYTVRDLVGKGVDPAVIRFELIRSHYRANLNFTYQGLEDSEKRLERWKRVWVKLESILRGLSVDPHSIPVDPSRLEVKGFMNALANDLNMAEAVASIDSYVGHREKVINGLHHGSLTQDVLTGIYQTMKTFDAVLGVIELSITRDHQLPQDAFALGKCAELDAARKAKDFAKADAVRAELNAAGYDVKTGKDGSVASKRLA